MSDWEIVGKPNYNNKDQFEVVNNNKEKDSTFSRVIKSLMAIPGQVKEAVKHPLDTSQDLDAGFVGGLQGFDSSVLELGEYLTRKGAESLLNAPGVNEKMWTKQPNKGGFGFDVKSLMNPNNQERIEVPEWKAREFSGLGGENPIDLQKMLSSGNENPLPGNIGKYLGGGLAGGNSFLRQAISNSLWSAAQAEPGNRLEEGVLGGALSMVPTALFKTPGALKSTYNYLNTGKAAEQFKNQFGEGTLKDNIKELAQRLTFAKNSAKEESLIPKREYYSEVGKNNVYGIPKEKLPEGNIPKLAHMIAPGEGYWRTQGDSLLGAIKKFRKNGNIDQFLEKAEDIFNVDSLPKSAAEKIEDAMYMPTKRESHYFSDHDVSSYYGKKGNLIELHYNYKKRPTLENYDKLQSALKDEIRPLQERFGNKTITDTSEAKLNQLKLNVKNLDKDVKSFNETLPERLKNLEYEFRSKYARNVGKYENAGKGAKDIIRNLSSDKWSQVTPSQVERIFSYPTKQVMEIIKDIGPSGARNIIYNAMRKVQSGDAAGLSKMILEMKQTKGMQQFVTPEMEQWAINMNKRSKTAEYIKNALSSAGAAGAGGALFGPVGAIIGGTLPLGYKAGKKLLNPGHK